MKLHQNKKLFAQAVRFTSDQLQIPAIYVEKDYWVSFALYIIFHNEIGKDTVFKGGTALSKCYKSIARFSEDIDLAVLRLEGESNNKLTGKLKQIEAVVNEFLPEINIEGITHKRGMNRKTAHLYTKEFKGVYGQVRDTIVLEATWLGNFEPYTTKKIISMVGEMMLNNNQAKIAADNGLLPFEVQVLEPIRTICEKVMSLVRFSYSETPIDDLKIKIRHAYDLHQLLQQEEYMSFLNSSSFEEMLLKVAADDKISYKNNNKWLAFHPSEAMIFRNLESIWPELRSVYSGDFKKLVYGNLPNETEVFSTLNHIRSRLGTITWS